jgi:hypothetical protein
MELPRLHPLCIKFFARLTANGDGVFALIGLEWPTLLHGEVPLRFVTAGEVVRCDASSFAVKLVGHQFRTMKRKITPIGTLAPNKPLAI